MEQLALFDELTLDGKIQRSIDVIKLAAEMSEQYYKKPLLVCYSGGKDSDVLLDLVKRAGVPFEVIHSLTTVDAPPTVQHIKAVFKELEEQGITATIKHPTEKGKNATMWRLIEHNTVPPTRTARYCCRVLKETSTPDRLAVLGVRRTESANRANRKEFELRGATKDTAPRYDFEHVLENYGFSQEHEGEENADVWDCKIISTAKGNGEILSNPIISWTDDDVWNYAERHNVKMNPLYSMGYKRVGCVGCPLAGSRQMKKQFEQFPKYYDNYMKAFDRALKRRRERGLVCNWNTAAEVMKWWLDEENAKDTEQVDGQETLF